MGDDTFNIQFKKIDERFDKIDERFDNFETSQTKMAIAIVNLQEEMKEVKETMATKEDIRGIHTTLDVIVKLVQKKDEENTST